MNAADLRRGVRDVAPLVVGIAPFGLVAGIAAVEAGLSPVQAVGLSVVVFAGASQLAALELLGVDAPLAIVVVTAVVVNLRMVMYSASIAPYFRTFAARWKLPLAYILTDQAYALSIARFRRGDPDRRAYYLGVAATLWVVWQIATVAGVAVGTGVPDAWGLEFAVPLVFLALLVPAMEDRTTSLAAVVGGAVALAAGGLALNLGLLAGATAGLVAGFGAELLGVGDGD